MNQTTVGQRFVELISHLGISKNAFANSLDKTATVVQHLVEERNKPGFDLLCKVFEVYPNVSKDWLMEGVGPMLSTNSTASSTPPAATVAAPVSTETTRVLPAQAAPAEPDPEVQTAKPAASVPQPVAAATAAPLPTPAVETSVEVPAAAAAAPAPVAAVAPVSAAPAVAAPAVPDAAWQTALYTQQMAHQLAMAELRNQHLQDQQRLMQQMLDLMQRRI